MKFLEIMKKFDKAVVKENKKLKSQASRDKRSAKGVIGENEAVDFANSLSYDPNVKRIDEMGSNVMTGLGDAIASSMYKKFAAGKLGAGALTAQAVLGLDKKSTEADFKAVDTVLKRLESFAGRINQSEGDAQKRIIEEAIKYASGTDAGGNVQLQGALDSALNKFLQAQDEATMMGVTPEISLDDTAVAGMIKASQQAGSAMAKEFRDNVKTVVKEIQEEQKKKS